MSLSAVVSLSFCHVASGAYDPCTPRQMHISPSTPASSSMTLSWVTQEACNSTAWVSPVSPITKSPLTKYEVVAHGEIGQTYTTNSQYGIYMSPYIHHVKVTDLKPATEYSYTVGSIDVVSKPHMFTTLPSAGSPGPVRIAVIGDLGMTAASVSTMEGVVQSAEVSDLEPDISPSFVMLVGDLSYGTDFSFLFHTSRQTLMIVTLRIADSNGTMWDTWGRTFEPYYSTLPLVAFPGNHEIEIDTVNSETFLHWRNRFRMPEVAPELTAPGKIRNYHNYDFNFTYEFGSSYFSFDVGPMHCICLNSYANSNNESVQYRWLERDLSSGTPPHLRAFNYHLIKICNAQFDQCFVS